MKVISISETKAIIEDSFLWFRWRNEYRKEPWSNYWKCYPSGHFASNFVQLKLFAAERRKQWGVL